MAPLHAKSERCLIKPSASLTAIGGFRFTTKNVTYLRCCILHVCHDGALDTGQLCLDNLIANVIRSDHVAMCARAVPGR